MGVVEQTSVNEVDAYFQETSSNHINNKLQKPNSNLHHLRVFTWQTMNGDAGDHKWESQLKWLDIRVGDGRKFHFW